MTSPAVGTGIVAFIEARLAKDEREITRSIQVMGSTTGGTDRALAQVAKDRAILALHQSWDRGFCHTCADGLDDYPCQTVRLLAAIDADHPDFDPDWKPVAG